MDNIKFAVFIPTHGRADCQLTYKLLRKSGYTGKIFLVVDDEDKELWKYKKRYSDILLVFNKKEWESRTDTATNKRGLKSVVFARKFIEEKAKEMGYDFILVPDDDISRLSYRYVKNGEFKSKSVNKADRLFEKVVNFINNGNIAILGFGWDAGYIGGANGKFKKGLIQGRSCEIIFRNLKIPVNYRSVINEDMIVNIETSMKGHPVFELTKVSCNVPKRGTNEGGNNGLYKTYKSEYAIQFYSVMHFPSCCYMKMKKGKIQLCTNWKNAIPKILSESYKRIV